MNRRDVETFFPGPRTSDPIGYGWPDDCDDHDHCPDCGAAIELLWSGVRCSAQCGWWYCV